MPASTLSPMNSLADLPGRLGRAVLRLALVLAGAVFLLSLLLASLVVVLGVSVWSLVTGRKPAPVVLFTRMREQSRRYSAGPWRSAGATPQRREGEVVDVEAREVQDPTGRKAP